MLYEERDHSHLWKPHHLVFFLPQEAFHDMNFCIWHLVSLPPVFYILFINFSMIYLPFSACHLKTSYFSIMTLYFWQTLQKIKLSEVVCLCLFPSSVVFILWVRKKIFWENILCTGFLTHKETLVNYYYAP